MSKKQLQFQHIKIHETFIKGCGTYVKTSKTMALPVFYSTNGEKRRFKATDSVSFPRKVKISSHSEGGTEISFLDSSAARINRFNKAVALVTGEANGR